MLHSCHDHTQLMSQTFFKCKPPNVIVKRWKSSISLTYISFFVIQAGIDGFLCCLFRRSLAASSPSSVPHCPLFTPPCRETLTHWSWVILTCIVYMQYILSLGYSLWKLLLGWKITRLLVVGSLQSHGLHKLFSTSKCSRINEAMKFASIARYCG